MKKILVLVIAIVMCVAVFAACGTEAPAGEAPAENEAVALEMFDAGNITINVPGGWNAFPVADIFAEEEGATDPGAVMVIKDGTSELDAFTNPYLQVNYYNANETVMMTPDPSWYDEVEDLEPMEIGGRTWNGFTAVSLDYPIATLWCVEGDDQFQVLIWTEVEGKTISVDDADVQAIIASISVK